MKEVENLIVCIDCGKPYQDGIHTHYESEDSFTVRTVKQEYQRGCPVCLSSIMLIPYPEIILCLNPKCSSYSVEKTKDYLYKIYTKDKEIGLASFTVNENNYVNIVWSLLGKTLFHTLMRAIANNYIKENIK